MQQGGPGAPNRAGSPAKVNDLVVNGQPSTDGLELGPGGGDRGSGGGAWCYRVILWLVPRR
jgi:hypothetical protein